ncbi:hypothetical protein LTR08_003108 [Meristemomyces frigidus]|nr:hypothetical protein LTR08_003108 [Meristemomyces frigidus]
MHELSEGLSKSLRSWTWRGSTHSNDGDVEKQDKKFEQALGTPSQSSVVLHAKLSRQALAEQHTQQQDGECFVGNKREVDVPHATHELAHGQNTQPHQTSAPAKKKKSVFTAPEVDDPDPASDRIVGAEHGPLSSEHFYDLIGMKKPVANDQFPKVLAVRRGLYGKIEHQRRCVQTQYWAYDALTYCLLVLQLMLSAVFIVLGSLASVDSHIAIAALGALSAVIGGLLALMKGQDELQNVTFEAEELYWDVAAGRDVYFRDIVQLREDYLRVMEDVRRNHPDTWNPTTRGIAQGVRTSNKNGRPARPATART